jgi:hypothetical protein
LQSTRLDTRKRFFKKTSADIPAHLWLWPISWVIVSSVIFMYSADFCSFPFGQNEKKVERWKGWKRQRLILVLARENVFKWWRDKMPVSFCVESISLKDKRNLKKLSLGRNKGGGKKRINLSWIIFWNTHKATQEPEEMGF